MRNCKEYGKSCIGIFYEKYCVSHIPFGIVEYTYTMKMNLTIISNFLLLFFVVADKAKGGWWRRQRHLYSTHTQYTHLAGWQVV